MIKKFLPAWLALDRSEKNFFIGLLMLFSGLTWSESVFFALIWTGAVLIVESTITSYMAALINARKQ